MLELITNPIIPYIASIPRNFAVGNGVRIFGNIGDHEARKFQIRLQCGSELSEPNDVAINISVSIEDGIAIVNSMRSGVWDDSQIIPNSPLRTSQKFELLIKCDISQYKIFINTRYYCGFPQRIPFDFITHIAILGDVRIEKICYEEQSLAIETPPPSYDEAQARAYANQTYDADPLLQPTPGRPPYPSDTNPLFQPALTETYYNPYQSQTITNGPATTLNAASPNFRPVQKSFKKRLIKGSLIVILLLVVVILATTIFPLRSNKHM